MKFKHFKYKPRPHDLRLALAAGTALLRDHEDTVAVFNVMNALQGNSILDCYLRLISEPNASRHVFEGPELWQFMDDPDWRRSFKPGSFGAAYARFVDSTGLEAGALQRTSFKSRDGELLERDHPVYRVARLTTAVHDLWHPLTGYGHDVLGEMCAVTFAYPQIGLLGNLAIGVGGLVQRPPNGLRAVAEAYRNGKDATWLLGLNYHELLERDLGAVRAQLNVRPPTQYQPWWPRRVAA